MDSPITITNNQQSKTTKMRTQFLVRTYSYNVYAHPLYKLIAMANDGKPKVSLEFIRTLVITQAQTEDSGLTVIDDIENYSIIIKSGHKMVMAIQQTEMEDLQPIPSMEEKQPEQVTLEDLPAGSLFKWNDTYGLKTCYGEPPSLIGAYAIGTGLQFYGDADMSKDQRSILVTPVKFL